MRKILLILYLFTVMVMPELTYAGYCEIRRGPECVEKGNRDIGGFTVYRDCWRYESKYVCYNDNYKDYCKPISETPGCTEIYNKCLEKSPTGECNDAEKIYKCGKKGIDSEGVVHLDTSYTIARDEKDLKECKENIISQDCELVEEKCLEPEGATEENGKQETRNINGLDVTKSCWKWDRKYACVTGSKISDCEELERKCVLVETRCLSDESINLKDSKNSSACHHIEKTYECLEITGQLPERRKCKKIGYCVGGDCEEYSYPENKNMPKAIAYLHLLKKMGDELKGELCDGDNLHECKIFKGEKSGCRKSVIGFKDCCKRKGARWGEKLKLQQCSEGEKMLREKNAAGLCYVVGTYCSNKLRFPRVCLTKTTNHCCFGSKLSKILQEQIRDQLEIDWGTPKEPNCRALTIEELQKADFSKIDLKDFFGDAIAKLNTNNHNTFSKFTGPDALKDKADEAMQNPDYDFFSRRYGAKTGRNKGGAEEKENARKYQEAVEKSIKRPFRKKVKDKEKVDLEGGAHG